MKNKPQPVRNDKGQYSRPKSSEELDSEANQWLVSRIRKNSPHRQSIIDGIIGTKKPEEKAGVVATVDNASTPKIEEVQDVKQQN